MYGRLGLYSDKNNYVLFERDHMNTKLTLELNKKAIDRAKKYAQKNKQSLSVMVEKYFNLISDLDLLAQRESHYIHAARLFTLIDQNEVIAYTSP